MLKKKASFHLTLAEANEHQRKHGFPPVGKTLVEVFEHAEKTKKLRVGMRPMNQTEREFAAMLERQKQAGCVLEYRFEAIALKWGDGMTFKSDFVVRRHADVPITLIEIKGVHIWKHAIVRFKGCRAEWKQWFDFEFWQKLHGSWTQLL